MRRVKRASITSSRGTVILPSGAKAALASMSETALARDCRLEVPLGELCNGLAPTLLILGPGKTRPDAIEPLTKADRFNAQGLEGKAVVIRPLREALAALSFLPEYRARVVAAATPRRSRIVRRNRFRVRRIGQRKDGNS